MKTLRRAAIKLAAPVFWLLVWQGISLWVGRELLLPAPLTVFARLFALARGAAFWRTMPISLRTA